MKKILLSIITFICLMISSGIAMDVHYCMGYKVSTQFFSPKNDKCQKCGMTENKGGCCNDEHSFYKFDSKHNTATAIDADIKYFLLSISKSIILLTIFLM